MNAGEHPENAVFFDRGDVIGYGAGEVAAWLGG
jgi:hypothetical protein